MMEIFCYKTKVSMQESDDKKVVKGASFQRLLLSDLISDPASSPLSVVDDISNSVIGSKLHAFTLAELRVITHNFARANLLEEGGFGPVYKGFVNDKLRLGLEAQPVAVKALNLDGMQGHREWMSLKKLSSSHRRVSGTHCAARRRVRYDSDDDEDGEEDQYYGHNEEIAMLELYTQSARGEALLVTALLDDNEVEVLIFKGFSSSLSHRTSADPSRSVLPSRAVIKSIDRIRGPFDPSNIQYIEKNIQWSAFKTARLPPTS